MGYVIGAFVMLIGIVMVIAGYKGTAQNLIPSVFGSASGSGTTSATLDSAITSALSGVTGGGSGSGVGQPASAPVAANASPAFTVAPSMNVGTTLV